MTPVELTGWLLVVTAAFSYLNHRFLKAPRAIGLLVGGLAGALVLFAVLHWMPGGRTASAIARTVGGFNFSAFLLNGVLGFIIFAGALDIDVEELRNRKTTVLVLATVGVLLSTIFVAGGSYAILRLFGVHVSLVACLLFGALISPTDPVAVLAIMRDLSVRKRLQVEMGGESLFNDGVAIVLFSIFVSAATTPSTSAAGLTLRSLALFAREGLGGVAAGAVLAFFVYVLLKSIDDPNIEVLMSVALVSGIVLASQYVGVSGPLGCAVAGLVIGNRGRRDAMHEPTQQALDTLWSFLDSVLNALLFFVLGVQALTIGVPTLRGAALIASVVPLVIAARFPAVYLASKVVPRQKIGGRAVVALSWGGLRGGVSVALALSLPDIPGKSLILAAAYATVLFSLLVQGLTVSSVLRRLRLQEERDIGRDS